MSLTPRGNESEVTTCEVTNIDKTPPEEPVVTADITEPTTQDVTLTAVYSDDSILRQYSTDGETWQDYAGDILVTENGSHYFRAVDAAGNESEITVYEVTNIDKAGPTIESVTGTDIAINSVLTVRVTAADDLSGVEATWYSLDNSPWKEFTNTFTITRNGTLTLKALDKAGNTTISDGMKITAFDQDALKLLRSETGEFATKQTGDQLRVYSDGTWKLKNIQTGTETELGKLDPPKWETAGSADFDGDGLLEMVMTDKTTGDLYLADDLSRGISEGKLTIKLGTLGPGYSFQGEGRFAGQTGQHDILLQGPAFGDASVSLNYGLPVWVNNTAGKRQYDGWLGALVNTWQMTLPLHGNTSDPADINAKNYQYGVVGIGDFNGDGRSDLLLQNTMPDNVSGVGITGAGDIFTFLTGDEAAVKGGTGPTVCYAGKADPANIKGWSIAGVGDFSGDSVDDVLLQNKSTGDIACWIMSDGQMQQSSWIGTTDLTIEGIWDVDADGTDDIILSDGISFTVWTVKNGALGGAQLLA